VLLYGSVNQIFPKPEIAIPACGDAAAYRSTGGQ